MSEARSYQPFDVENVKLEGSNLIEASAGTGKTYSIAILVLRLLLENALPVTEILMVTFTNAAVAELKERIRNFIHAANRCCDRFPIDDPLVQRIVEENMAVVGEDEVRARLRSAWLHLDETSIMTIHSFCQQSLREFAFEAEQFFDWELVEDCKMMVEESTRKFWRQHVTQLPVPILSLFEGQGLTFKRLSEIVSAYLSGKYYFSFDSSKTYSFDLEEQAEYARRLKEGESQVENLQKEAVEMFLANRQQYGELCKQNQYAQKSLLPCIDVPEKFLDALAQKKDKGYAQKFAELLSLVEAREEERERLREAVLDCMDAFYAFASQEIAREIEDYKIANSLMGFEDLIGNLHRAVCERGHKRLAAELQKKYKAVFIDEFQDTDQMQYAIFQKVFQGKSTIFYIGDPKQSIYAFRTADIETYFKARTSVDRKYSMNVNYRSTSSLIEAMNRLFLPPGGGGFDTFFYGDEQSRIDYHPVNAPDSPKKWTLQTGGQEVCPISVIYGRKKPEVQEAAAVRILDLLTNEEHSFVGQNGERRKISPADIGVLVRNNREGEAIQRLLNGWGVPTTINSRLSIFDSREAVALAYLLEAFFENSIPNIRRVLQSPLLAWTPESILNADGELLVQQFRSYRERWQLNGIYAAISDFAADFQINERLMGAGQIRTVTNLEHLKQILHEEEARAVRAPEGLLGWLKTKSSGVGEEETDADEIKLRIESDEEAVRIVTIHSSKGLQYPIVFAPSLDFAVKLDPRKLYAFRTPEGVYRTVLGSRMNAEQRTLWETQEEQENRRLFYVAITRAEHKCFLFRSENASTRKTTFNAFLEALKLDGRRENGIQKEEAGTMAPPKRYESESRKREILKAAPFTMRGSSWMRLSYTALAAQKERLLKERFVSEEESYDRFVFHELQRGVKTGNFLHAIFEEIDFSSPDHSQVIQKAIQRFFPRAADDLSAKVQTLLTNILQAELVGEKETFRLASLQTDACLHELEFDFPVSLMSPKELESLPACEVGISNRFWTTRVEGAMNGKIDLLFAHDGTYYILDWKTTYLGPDLNNYLPEALGQAMNEQNYHLQYLIYSLSAARFLKSRLGDDFQYERDFGGVFYLFVRGMRSNTSSGVYFRKPSAQEIALLESKLCPPAK